MLSCWHPTIGMHFSPDLGILHLPASQKRPLLQTDVSLQGFAQRLSTQRRLFGQSSGTWHVLRGTHFPFLQFLFEQSLFSLQGLSHVPLTQFNPLQSAF